VALPRIKSGRAIGVVASMTEAHYARSMSQAFYRPDLA